MAAIQESSPLGAGGNPGPSIQDIQNANSGPATSRDDAPQAKSHPLGPLTAQEIVQTAGLIRGCWPDDIECHFKVVTLLEPAKSELLPYLVAERAGQDPGIIDRRAFVVYYFRGTVSLGL
jgi:primary-amine oxidase